MEENNILYVFLFRIPEHISRILSCAKEGKLFSTQNRGCNFPLSQGHCDEGEMVVLGRKGSGICVPRLCEEDQVFKDGKCVDLYKGKDCQGKREMLQYNLMGEAVCGCEEGWGKVEEGRNMCFQHFTRGPCPGGEIVSPLGKFNSNFP